MRLGEPWYEVVVGHNATLCNFYLGSPPSRRCSINGAPRLRVVANCGVGYDNIDVAACTARRIVAYLDGLQAKVDALKRFQAETAAELDALLPSILDRAFRAEL